jgi:hypothetical protein
MHKQIYTNTHTVIAPPIGNILDSVNFWAFIKEMYLPAESIPNEHQETLENQVNFFYHSFSMGECTLHTKEGVMSDNRCLDLHVISFLPCQSACTTP